MFSATLLVIVESDEGPAKEKTNSERPVLEKFKNRPSCKQAGVSRTGMNVKSYSKLRTGPRTVQNLRGCLTISRHEKLRK